MSALPNTSGESKSQRISIVLIGSPGHSGQTWVNLMLGAHPEVLALGEINHAEKLKSLKGICSVCGDGCEFWDKFDEVWDREENLFVALAEFSGKSIIAMSGWGKFRRQFRDPRIDRKFIRLIRDGRASSASFFRKYPERGYENHAQRWARKSRKLDRQARDYAANDTTVIRYEDLLENTEQGTAGLCKFLGIEYSPGMNEYWNGIQHTVGANRGTLSYMRRNLGKSGPRGDKESRRSFYEQQDPSKFRDERWRKELDRDDLLIFEKEAGALNRKYGYPPSELNIGTVDQLKLRLIGALKNFPGRNR